MSERKPITPELRQFWIRLPRSQWISAAAVVLAAGAIALRAGLPIYRQQLAIREIERLGGSIRTQKIGPTWLREAIGAERACFYEPVIAVSLNSTEVTNSGLANLRHLTMLRELDLSNNTQITDAGVQNVEALSCLRKLYVHGTIISKTWIRDATRKHRDLEVYASGSVYAYGADTLTPLHLRTAKDHFHVRPRHPPRVPR